MKIIKIATLSVVADGDERKIGEVLWNEPEECDKKYPEKLASEPSVDDCDAIPSVEAEIIKPTVETTEGAATQQVINNNIFYVLLCVLCYIKIYRDLLN